jgi:hypothetical protein
VSDRQDAFRKKVEADRRKRATLYFNYPGPWEFLFSEAGRAITKTHPSAIVVYLHVIARQPLPPKKKERMRLEKLGLWPPKDPKEFSFPIEEGPIQGLGKSATASGLFILHNVGAIDRLHPGSATRGEFATYVLSDRWRQWRPPSGGPDFVALEWKKAQVIGTRDTTIVNEDGIVVHKGTGKFLKRGRSPKTSRKVRVVASRTTSKPSLVAMITTSEKPLVAMTTMNKAPDADPLVAMTTIFLSSPVVDSNLKTVKKVKKKVRPLGHGSKSIAAATKPWRPHITEIRWNVREILLQRPDQRADDQRFVRFLTDQLIDVQRGNLDPRRVHRDLQDRHDLDDWTADLLFTIATIDLQFRGATQ